MPTANLSTGIRISVMPGGADKDVFIVRVDGSIDTVTADELDSVLGSLVRQKRFRLVIDLAGTEYVSSAGWGIFISRLREVREGQGDLKLARLTEPVRDVYDLLELDGVLARFDRVDDATSQFNGAHEPLPPAIARAPMVDQAPAESAPRPSSLTEAILAVVMEDPFYSLREMRARLKEIGEFRPGRMALMTVLWRKDLFFRHQRFRHYRRHSPTRLLGR